MLYSNGVKDTIIFLNTDKSFQCMRSIGIALDYLSSMTTPRVKVMEVDTIPDATVLSRCRSFIIRNLAYHTQINSLRNLRDLCDRNKIKLIYLNDIPIVAGEDGIEQIIPDFIKGYAREEGYTIERSSSAMRCMSICHSIIVPTYALKNHLKMECGIETHIDVLPNLVPRYVFSKRNTNDVKKDVIKLHTLYIPDPLSDFSNQHNVRVPIPAGIERYIKKWLPEKQQFSIIYEEGGFPLQYQGWMKYLYCSIQQVHSMYELYEKLKTTTAYAGLIFNDTNEYRNSLIGNGRFLEYYACGVPVMTNLVGDENVNHYHESAVFTVRNNISYEEFLERWAYIGKRENYNAIIDSQTQYIIDNKLWVEDNVERLLGIL